MRKLIMLLTILAMASMASAAPKCPKVTKANQTHHVVKTSTKPFKRMGHGAKVLGQKLANTTVSVAGFSFLTFDTMVIDPLGVALQAFADGVDMFVAAPLESLPEPFEAVGDGVHYVYAGIDKVGQILAK